MLPACLNTHKPACLPTMSSVPSRCLSFDLAIDPTSCSPTSLTPLSVAILALLLAGHPLACLPLHVASLFLTSLISLGILLSYSLAGLLNLDQPASLPVCHSDFTRCLTSDRLPPPVLGHEWTSSYQPSYVSDLPTCLVCILATYLPALPTCLTCPFAIDLVMNWMSINSHLIRLLACLPIDLADGLPDFLPP